MTDYGLVSIIMPSYNVSKYIKDSINSVLEQTYSNWELIIIDDCSIDDTCKIVNTFKDDRIILINNRKNSGAAISRNSGIKIAKGNWIAFLDSDDLWESTKLEKHLEFMCKNDYGFSYTNYSKIDENGSDLHIQVTGPKVIDNKKMYHYDYIGCLTAMYSKSKVGLIQIEDIKKNNDYAMWLKIVKKSNCYLLDENLGKYRIREKSISHDNLIKKVKSHYDLYRICDKKSSLESFFLTIANLFFGIIKKIKYERKY